MNFSFSLDTIIVRNRDALIGIIGSLLALMSAVGFNRVQALFVMRILLSAESAIRRLIVLHMRHHSVSAMPQKTGQPHDFSFAAFTRASNGAAAKSASAFSLIDRRKRFRWLATQDADNAHCQTEPRIRQWWAEPPATAPLSQFVAKAPPNLNTDTLRRRLVAANYALKDLGAQARRLARLLAKRASAPSGPRCVGPLRPGLPPGYRHKHTHDVDSVLADCHAFAMEPSLSPP